MPDAKAAAASSSCNGEVWNHLAGGNALYYSILLFNAYLYHITGIKLIIINFETPLSMPSNIYLYIVVYQATSTRYAALHRMKYESYSRK